MCEDTRTVISGVRASFSTDAFLSWPISYVPFPETSGNEDGDLSGKVPSQALLMPGGFVLREGHLEHEHRSSVSRRFS